VLNLPERKEAGGALVRWKIASGILAALVPVAIAVTKGYFDVGLVRVASRPALRAVAGGSREHETEGRSDAAALLDREARRP
jgi:hypothetical protein